MLRRITDFAGSMAGRIFAILVVGIVSAALVAAMISGLQRRADVAAERADRIIDRVVTAMETGRPVPGARELALWPAGRYSDRLTRRLVARVPDWRDISVEAVDRQACAPAPPPPPAKEPDVAPPPSPPPPDCFAVRLTDGRGKRVVLAIDAPPPPKLVDDEFGWSFLVALGLAALILALVISRMTARPIARLGAAAQALAENLDAAPIPLSGPNDVCRTIAAFNHMQVELRRTIEQRSYMLAAILHDLRSPLTRMRLRLEAVADEALREKLVGDAQAMADLIEDGLELARLSHSREHLARVDVSALIESLCEDAADVGQDVTCARLPRMIVETRPGALRRILTNVIENALKYGERARVSAAITDSDMCITVKDDGPGIPPEALEKVFEPFHRLDEAPTLGQGNGLGLTIAGLLAHQIGGSILLANHPAGGLIATIRIPLPARR